MLMGNRLISQLGEYINPFLTKWTEGMEKAGYLRYTTAKREDCIDSFWFFLKPLMVLIETEKKIAPFGELIQQKNEWTQTLVEVSRRHRFRGIKSDMFFGCFKTFIHAVEELVLEMKGGPFVPTEAEADAVGGR